MSPERAGGSGLPPRLCRSLVVPQFEMPFDDKAHAHDNAHEVRLPQGDVLRVHIVEVLDREIWGQAP